jgi:hypothetical protein
VTRGLLQRSVLQRVNQRYDRFHTVQGNKGSYPAGTPELQTGSLNRSRSAGEKA